MSVHDTIADAITIIRNGSMAKKKNVSIPNSKKLFGIVKILKDEGYIESYRKINIEGKAYSKININLKYSEDNAVIDGIKRVSKPGLRIYSNATEIPRVYNGLGTAVVSTPEGIITGKEARKRNVGGEILFYIW